MSSRRKRTLDETVQRCLQDQSRLDQLTQNRSERCAEPGTDPEFLANAILADVQRGQDTMQESVDGAGPSGLRQPSPKRPCFDACAGNERLGDSSDSELEQYADPQGSLPPLPAAEALDTAQGAVKHQYELNVGVMKQLVHALRVASKPSLDHRTRLSKMVAKVCRS